MRGLNLVKSWLLLRCSNHPEEETLARTAADFKKVPEDGCWRPCGKTLTCGHICPKHCHVLDRDHKETLCTRPCTKVVCKNGHRCNKMCYENCGECKTIVEKTIPLCLHKASMNCSQDPISFKCQTICLEMLLCGHNCQKTCHDSMTTGKLEEQCKESKSKLWNADTLKRKLKKIVTCR